MTLRDLTPLHIALILAATMFAVAGGGTWCVRNWLGLGEPWALLPAVAWLVGGLWFTTRWWRARTQA